MLGVPEKNARKYWLRIRVGLVQMAATSDGKTCSAHLTAWHQAPPQRRRKSLLPELFRTQIFLHARTRRCSICRANSRADDRPAAEVAKQLRIVVVGSIFEKRRWASHNTAVMLDATAACAIYRKMHIRTIRFTTRKYYFHARRLGYKAFRHFGRKGGPGGLGPGYPKRRRRRCRRAGVCNPTAIGWHPDEKGTGTIPIAVRRLAEMQRAACDCEMACTCAPSTVWLRDGDIAATKRRQGLGVLGGRSMADPSGDDRPKPHTKGRNLIGDVDAAVIEDTRRQLAVPARPPHDSLRAITRG